MDMTEKTLASREVYRGRIIRVREDTVLLPNGKEGRREVVEHPGGVGILALDGDDVLLVRQYRYAFSRVLTEIPAGKRETGDSFNMYIEEYGTLICKNSIEILGVL